MSKSPIRIVTMSSLLVATALLAGCSTNGGNSDPYNAEPEETDGDVTPQGALEIEVEPVVPDEADPYAETDGAAEG